MKPLARMMLAGVLGLLGIASTAKAQQPVYRTAPAYRPAPATYAAPRRIFATPWREPRRLPVLPHTHNHRDWTTGNENLPLAKPWLHQFRT